MEPFTNFEPLSLPAEVVFLSILFFSSLLFKKALALGTGEMMRAEVQSTCLLLSASFC